MGQLVADLARRARLVVIFCILDVPRINQGAFDGPMLAVNHRSSQSTWPDWAIVCQSPSTNSAISITDRALIDDGYYLQQLPIISLVMRTHFGPNTSYGSWQTVSVLLILVIMHS